jgi:diguanylate cyclase (GGDEF)-like protein
MATYDRLTGLPNRALFRDQVRTALAQSRRSGQRVAILVVDVDGFRTVNLTLGHAAGDRLLSAVAQRLGAAVREGDAVARLDGGEFAVLSVNVDTAEAVDAQARRVLESLSRPFVVGTHEISLRASIGITVFPDDAGSVEQLINNAGAAQRAVQESGGSGYRFFAAELNARLRARLALEGDLRHALAREQMVLHYQPKVDVATGRVRGFEALVRWQHPTLGQVSPADFIPVAEETGLIVPIGEWVLRTACRQVRAWIDAGLPALPVAVNLSARQFREEGLVELVLDAIAQSRIDPRLLELEVTETLLMEDTARTVRWLEALRGQGITIALDDFGTGYSSLSYLKRFPVDTIKMDKSFVRDVASDAQSGAIATAIVTLAHSLGMDVVAEGVETREQLESLAARGCDTVQGFLFSRPVPHAEIPELVRRTFGPTLAPPAAAARPVRLRTPHRSLHAV